MREAFGEDLAQAGQRLGNTVQQVGQQASAMITRQQERDDEQAVIEASTSFMKEMSDNSATKNKTRMECLRES